MNGETDSNKDAPQSTNQSPLPSPMPPNAAPLGNKESNPSQTSGTETEELLRGTRTIEILQLSVNAALAVLGVIALCIYGGQLKVMRGQLNQMVQQLPEFQKSANAAEQSARVAKDTLVAINRPWVGIDSTPTVRQASER